jgi:hypothetical protein
LLIRNGHSGTFCGRNCYFHSFYSTFSEWAMRRIWLLSLLALPLLAGATASIPTHAQAQDVLGLMRAPMRVIQNLGLHGRLYHRRQRARPASVSTGPDPRQEVARVNDQRTPAGYWPDGYDDLFGFTFAPGTGDRFWQHGSFDILIASLSPSATTRASLARRATQAKATNPCEGTDATGERAGTALYQEIEKNVQPTAEQAAAFKDLREALITASRRVEAACAAGFSSARPNERLMILADRLAAMRHAMLVVRTPLEAAYNTLSDEQKTRLDGSNTSTVSCSTDLAAAGAWPRNEIMRAVQPNEAQAVALERFRGTFLGMSQQLASSCPQQPLGTIITRLDAAGERLNAVLYATRMVNRSLNGAYAKLDNGQRARLLSVGRQLRFHPARAAELGAR